MLHHVFDFVTLLTINPSHTHPYLYPQCKNATALRDGKLQHSMDIGVCVCYGARRVIEHQPRH